MTNLIIQVSRYLIIILMALYTFQCFTVFQKKKDEAREYLFLRQNVLMFAMHFTAYVVLYLEKPEMELLFFYGAQVIYLAAVLVLFRNLYPLASKLLINNMCMLVCIGFIMITRLKYDSGVKQFKIAIAATIVALLIPLLIRKLRFITKMYWLYTLMGIGLLGLVAIAAQVTNGAKLSFSVGGISIQPSEFVKIVYVFAIAGLLANARDFRRIVIATGLAALHVLILVISKDLGSAMIYFMTYLTMLFVSTRNPFLVLSGILAGSGAAVGAYFLFDHVKTRVSAWQDPFKDYQVGGYQICQSLFAISAGGWFGTGLYQGSPEAIPYVEQDFMFSAISEELGSIFGICLILVCMSCFIMFVNIAMQLTNRFYRLVAVGLGSTYAVQIFLTVGGGIKLIPMTGVTLPLVSYGGSSLLSTMIMFSIVQGLYMLQRDEERKKEARYQQQEYEAVAAYSKIPNRYDEMQHTKSDRRSESYGSYDGDGYGNETYSGYAGNGYGNGSDSGYDGNGYGNDSYNGYDGNSYGSGSNSRYSGNGYGNEPYGGYDGNGYGDESYGNYDGNGYGNGSYSGYDGNGYGSDSYNDYDGSGLNGSYEQNDDTSHWKKLRARGRKRRN